MKLEFRFKDTKEFLYLFLWFIYSFTYIINSSLIKTGPLFKIECVVFLGILMIMFFQHNYMKLKKILLAVLFFSSCLLIFRITKKPVYVLYVMFIANSDYAKFDKIVKTTMISIASSTAIVIFMSLIGFIPDYIFIRDTGEVAHSLGFTYYYNASAQALFASVLYLYLKDKVSWIELFVIAMISYLIYKKCTTRLPLYVLLIILLMYVVIYKWDILKRIDYKWIKAFSVVAFPAVCTFCAVFALNYDGSNPVYRFSNDILNGRPRLSYVAFKRYGVKLLGQYVEMQGHVYGENGLGSYFFIDSGYILSLVEYGLLFTIIISILYSMFYYYACKTNDKKLFIWISMTLVFNVVNGCWFTLIYNPIFFILFHMEYRNSIFNVIKSKIKIKGKPKRTFICRE